MASISKDKNGNRTIQFVAGDSKRRSVRLGKVSQKIAESIKLRIETLNACAIAKAPWDTDLATWVANVGEELAGKLAAVGLIPVRASGHLGAFLDEYIEGRTDTKPRTTINLRNCASRLKEYFTPDRTLTSITAGDADTFVVWLKDRYADGTTARTIGRARQFFRAATRRKLIDENPFADAKQPSQVNAKRQFFVTREMTAKVLDKCPNAEWRLIVALCRYGGIRCPSELVNLRWDEVLWDEGKFLVHSPKTEHHHGGQERWTPIFPELRSHLAESFEQAEDGAVHLVERATGAAANLRTRFAKIIRRAGLTPWPKLFVNLRSSRETELVQEYPLHIVCAWLGNSALIAQKHYLQVTDADFRKASGVEGGVHGGAESGAVVVQKAVQSGDVSNCQE